MASASSDTVEPKVGTPPPNVTETKRLGYLWEQSILKEERSRYCDTEMGEEIGWLMSPILSGFYYGYVATKNPQWIGRLIDWTDSWVRRGIIEPDGYLGWPRIGAAGTPVDNLDSYYADSLLGEAMALRPVVLMAAAILKDPILKARYGGKADDYIKLAKSIFEKWNKRGAWRADGSGMITVVLPYGIDQTSGAWTSGVNSIHVQDQGFSHPNNKANLVALWLLAMSDATGDSIYRDRAESWFRLMKSRMQIGKDGAYRIWSYWAPAGVWDYRADGSPKHWLGVHRNSGYYTIDVDAIIEAYKHGLVFTGDDIQRLIKTASVSLRFWPALAPYDKETEARLEVSLRTVKWGQLSLAPWYLAFRTHHVN